MEWPEKAAEVLDLEVLTRLHLKLTLNDEGIRHAELSEEQV